MFEILNFQITPGTEDFYFLGQFVDTLDRNLVQLMW